MKSEGGLGLLFKTTIVQLVPEVRTACLLIEYHRPCGCWLGGILLFAFASLDALRVLTRWLLDASFQDVFVETAVIPEADVVIFRCPRLPFGRSEVSISGPRKTISAVWRHSGRPGEQQKGHVGVQSRFYVFV